MKKVVFTLAAIFSLSLLTPVFATENVSHHYPKKYSKGYGDAITFVEDGITFSIFKNGEFDFYINPRAGLYAGVDFGNVSISYNSGYNYDPFVQYDDYGAIVQIENVPIYYDYYGRITRAGDVRINYYGRRLHRVGGLRVHYNVHGHYTHCSGFINRYNRHYIYHPFHSFFTVPIYTHTIVSYKPYRKYYAPKRYRYDSGRRYTNSYYKKHRRYKNVNNRIRNKSDRRSYYKRNNSTTYKRNANTTRRNVAKNNRSVNTSRRDVVKNRKPVKRTTTVKRSGSNDKRVISRRNNRVKTFEKRPAVKRTDRKTMTKSPSVRKNNTARSYNRSVKQQPVKRPAVKRTVRKSPVRNYKRSTVKPTRKAAQANRGNGQKRTSSKNRRYN